jgi:HD-GYP domain-containing protein (c-di-GMP phosphodiesterase class II)
MRILRLALETNKAGGNAVDPVQLEAAVYLHDVGMMLLPEAIWLKIGKMTNDDKLALRNHPGYAAGLLQRMPGWESAAEMVVQHHEMPDGGGYPKEIKAADICAGAKILAIVDAFEAVMLKHIHRGKNRSVLRAIAEINACDNQFAPEWIAPFNAVIRKTIEN